MIELSDQIISIISEKIDVPKEEITPEKTFSELGIDSLDGVELMMELENQLRIKISDPEMEGIKTVGDIISMVESKKTAITNEK